MSDTKIRQKNTESAIVSLIIVLALILVIAAGVFIYRNNSGSNVSFGGSGGGGGGMLPAPTFPVNKPGEIIADKPNDSDNKPQKPSEPQEPAEPVVPEEDKWAKKDEFLEKADEIILYSETYLETATTQYELNNESSIVFQKWDDLLNEVYDYLETIMNDRDFEELEEAEIAWVVEKENAIAETGAEWGDGSGAIMAQNMTAIEYTIERCYYLISLIN